LMTTTEIENFPGFADAIMGPELMDNMRKQAERFGAEFITDDATRLELAGDIKTVHVGNAVYQAKAVIVSTGSAWRHLNVPGEDELLGHGVSSCATCDGFFFRDQDIAVVGGGDSAMEEATFLTRFASTVTIVHRRDEFRASKIMVDRALANEKIKIEWNSVITEILGDDGKVVGVRLKDTVSGDERVLDTSGVFVAIGHDPRSELVVGQLDTGVFAAGDVVDHTYRQAITAAGTGCAAALDAERYLAALEA
jgi:thioredoxin reductase (NADPH)